MAEMTGSCLCGNVTYSTDADPILTATCHCADCQKQTGTAFSTVVAVPRAAFHVDGDTLSSFTTIGEDTGKPTERAFCSACGSPIVSYAETLPDMALIKAGTLDDRSWLEPQLEVWCDSAQPWVPETTEQRFGRAPSVPA